ncbi:MAG: hypothetical protein M4579_001569 [Chaenotheca gracillima]|nr:MAG: hypothetical protein M4579_001569 [Chaenotheca gracillima]
MNRRISSTPHYQTFPVKPPASQEQTSSSPTRPREGADGSRHEHRSSSSGNNHQSPLPKKQLCILAVIALAEQTALNSISPYIPEMAGSFPEVDVSQVGLYVGLIASSFALAQLATGFFWGWLSDRIGRKPVILVGTLLTAACFVAFGFCRTLWQAVLVQLLMGLVNGNQGVVATCLGEITDRSNQSKAFVYLPVVYGIGGITGPIVGGLLVSRPDPAHKGQRGPYPYLAPNLVSAGLLAIDLILTMFFLEESLEEARNLPPLSRRVRNVFTRLWQFTSSTRPSYLRPGRGDPSPRRHRREPSDAASADGLLEDDDDEDDSETSSQVSMPTFFPERSTELKGEQVIQRDTILLLATYLIFQLSNVSYNSLYPIFASSPPPTGRSLSPQEIGLSLSFAGAVCIVFQVGIFGKLREKIGNRVTYRVGLAGFVVSFLMMPFVGYKDSPALFGVGQGKVWLWIEIGFVLLVKTVAAVGGLTSALLLITNSAPNHSVLGTLNGIAQTLSAAGRAAGPFLSGGLFSVATHVQPKGEALVFGIFGGIAFAGFLLSFGIRSEDLEGEEWDEEEGSTEGEDDEDDDADHDRH